MKHFPTAAAVIACLIALAWLPHAQASEALSQKGGCMVCHLKDKKLVGPSYKDIAAKYRGDAGAAERLFTNVRKGRQGVWGQIPMPPTDASRIGDADLRALNAWILKQ